MNKVTDESNNRRSSSVDDQEMSDDEQYVQKRKLRRVRPLVKYPTGEAVDDKQPQSNNNTTNIRHNLSASSSDKSPFPFGQCRVCMDKATGAHYGIPTCEGCKGFFKRSILRKEKYRCFFGDQCVVTTNNRNRCKSCRFKKCLQQGMSFEGVRMGRIPKLVKQKALAEYQSSSSSIENDERSSSSSINSNIFTQTDFDLQLIDENIFLDKTALDIRSGTLPLCTSYILPNNFTIDETKHEHEQKFLTSNRSVLTSCKVKHEEQVPTHVIERIEKLVIKISHPILQVELDNEESSLIRYLRWKLFDLCHTFNKCTRQLIDRMNRMIDLEITVFPGDHSSHQDILIGLTDAIPYHVKNLIIFAREMPAVNEIDGDDFNKIMNNRLFDFWLIKHAPLIHNNESYIMLPNGLQYTRRWMNIIMGEEMVKTMFEFAKKFNELDFTQEERALIFPVVICSKDKTLNEQEIVHRIQYIYLHALYAQMLTTRTEFQAKTVFRNLLQILALLPLLNELQDEKVDPFIPESMESSSRLVCF